MALLAPYGLHVQLLQPTSVVLAWDDVPNALGYELIDAPTGNVIARTSDTNAVVQGLTPGSSYGFQLRAYNVAEFSPLGPPLRVQTP